ncbi:SDR family NAD(P)-dependent oxidoreductase [Kineosporia babensis]|uniref:SDR family NAD(P)-dependent oxidoreductase n=1 Tax=Kineosporia babensis TaxID=499548 RepID=A0A9X1NJG3_9ACTN|nr:SDR family NAD(P)-dependent oxidoreductase [Kineosporia babensis]MCD5314836.1 SDR family NAD(P)-dependent oxidoreductase [Kineosporia babensis]
MSGQSLTGKVVAVVGSSGGLGTALARSLRARGARLALLDLDAGALERQSTDLAGPNLARGWPADVTDLAGLQNSMNAAAEHFGRIDVVVANAGVDSMAPLSTLDEDVYERVIDINLNGVWRTFRAALPHVQQRHGYLLAISSMAAFVHSPLQTPYNASKAGVWALCNSLRLEVRHLGVDVGSAHPTFFPTPMTEKSRGDQAGRTLYSQDPYGLWTMVPLEQVVRDIVAGIERRARLITTPRRLSLVARAPGLVQPLIDRVGFPGTTITEAIAHTSSRG